MQTLVCNLASLATVATCCALHLIVGKVVLLEFHHTSQLFTQCLLNVSSRSLPDPMVFIPDSPSVMYLKSTHGKEVGVAWSGMLALIFLILALNPARMSQVEHEH